MNKVTYKSIIGILAFSTTLSSIVAHDEAKNCYRIADECKQKMKDMGASSSDIIKTIKKDHSVFRSCETAAIWQHAADSIEANVKATGIAKKAYFEGQQAIRDSIKAASKIRP